MSRWRFPRFAKRKSWLYQAASISTYSTCTKTENYSGTKLVGVAFEFTMNLLIWRCFAKNGKQMYENLIFLIRSIDLRRYCCGCLSSKLQWLSHPTSYRGGMGSIPVPLGKRYGKHQFHRYQWENRKLNKRYTCHTSSWTNITRDIVCRLWACYHF